MSAAETISLLRAHCDANSKRERATFSIASIRELLAFVDDCAATIRPFPPLPSRELGSKASMSRELLGAVVDDVFDGAIEDPSVIEDIYASIKRHEGALSTNAEPVGELLQLPYKNWRGEISTRKLQPIRLEFGATEWHPEPQWLLVATDVEKNAERSFALKDFNPQQPAPAVVVKDACAPALLLYNVLMEAINEGVAKATDPDWTTKDFGKSPHYQAIHATLSQVQDAAGSLTLSDLQAAHVERQKEWCPDVKPDLSFRGNELGGECGEAQNVIKKLERERHGWRGSRDTVEHLAEELADVIHCTMLVAITAGIDLEQSVVAKFNDTSAKNNLSTKLPASKHGDIG